MELAADTKCERNIVHRDVIDALIRQPFSNETLPFKANIILPGSTLMAVDYDLGRNGAAYFDMDTANYRLSTGKESTGNSGGVYRNDGVDIYRDPNHLESYYVGKIEKGEWLQYTIHIKEGGEYKLVFNISGNTSDGLISLSEGATTIQDLKIPSTGGYEIWKKISTEKFELTQGIHKLRVHAEKGGFNFESMQFLK
jgi:endoglucanase